MWIQLTGNRMQKEISSDVHALYFHNEYALLEEKT